MRVRSGRFYEWARVTTSRSTPDGPDIRILDRFKQRPDIGAIGLVAANMGAHVLGRDQDGLNAQGSQAPGEVTTQSTELSYV